MEKSNNNKKKNKLTNINIFFRYLNKAGVSYVLLTNYYYESQKGGDVDLYIPLHDKDVFLKVIYELGFKHRKKPPVLPNHNFYIFFDGLNSILLDVKFKLSFYSQDGYLWVYNLPERVISDKRMIKDSFRPGGFDAIILYAAHCGILERLKIEPSHIQNLKRYLADFRSEVYSPENIKILDDMELCLRKHNLKLLPQELSRIIRPFFSIKKKFTRWRKFRLRFSFGLGFIVLFLGADGTGKTTLVKALQKVLPLKNKILYLGMGKENWLLGFVQKYQKFCQEVPWAGRFRLGLLFSWVLLPLELSMRRLKASLSSKYAVILIDRFPGYPFIQGGFLKWLYRHILPEPDLIVLLSGDPDSIFRRKPYETTTQRVKKELIKWARVAERISAAQVLEVDTTSKEVQECLGKILINISRHPAFKQKMFKPVQVKKRADILTS